MNERERALQLLQRIERESAYASLLLYDQSGFVRTLVLGVLRWRSRLDFIIETLSGRRLAKVDGVVVDLLRIGIYQLAFMEVAPYAAVSETVDLAGRHANRARGFVNAVLRKAAAGLPEPKDLATRTAHPEWLIERWTRMFGEERARAMTEANQELSYPDVFSLGGAPPPTAAPSSLVEGVFKLQGSSETLSREEFYPLDEGSAVIATIAANSGGDVLDLTAAPGGKTIVMRARGANVVSNDISISRLRPLIGRHRKIVVSDGRRAPFANVATGFSPSQRGLKPAPTFDTVLLDAPCSATGTIRKNPELKWRLKEDDLKSFASLQRDLLTSALDISRQEVVYSTCSLEPEENDEVIGAVLEERSDFVREDIAPLTPAGARRWVEDGVLRLTPESGADGFTAFRLRRKM